MPFEIEFTKKLDFKDPDQYFNECCFGGDLVVDKLLPMVKSNYQDIQSNQEDWGWFIWFKQEDLSLAIDVFCDDPELGKYRIFLTARQKRWLGLSSKVIDDPKLLELKQKVKDILTQWLNVPCTERTLDENYG